ncbi:hypothetical protein PVAND_001545 [Polypedilum vanderplanki]|uniref:Uncharacterized protein n=1 Tax=Polypedilum vanderplanki TaxID=319348 RepID=A0A9J6BPI7_POLVA|nr:hypothetical protein PVAND_001545 [Polypedilum vanderplanki]
MSKKTANSNIEEITFVPESVVLKKEAKVERNIKIKATNDNKRLKKKKKTFLQQISHQFWRFWENKQVQRIKSFKFGNRDHFGKNRGEEEGEANEFDMSKKLALATATAGIR